MINMRCLLCLCLVAVWCTSLNVGEDTTVLWLPNWFQTLMHVVTPINTLSGTIASEVTDELLRPVPMTKVLAVLQELKLTLKTINPEPITIDKYYHLDPFNDTELMHAMEHCTECMNTNPNLDLLVGQLNEPTKPMTVVYVCTAKELLNFHIWMMILNDDAAWCENRLQILKNMIKPYIE